MKKEFLLRQIAQSGYNVGFGAKTNFATFDVVEKAPGWIAFITLAVGAYSLFIHALTHEQVTAFLLLLGIASLFLSGYNHDRERYDHEGKRLTQLFHRLRDLYFEVKSITGDDAPEELLEQHRLLLEEVNAHTLSKHVFTSDWYAHYKFFWQMQIEWIDEQLHFRLRDKIPLSLAITVAGAIGVAALAAWKSGCIF